MEEEAIIYKHTTTQHKTADAIKFTKKEVDVTISKQINARKSPGYDLITGRILKELLESGIFYLTQFLTSY